MGSMRRLVLRSTECTTREWIPMGYAAPISKQTVSHTTKLIINHKEVERGWSKVEGQ